VETATPDENLCFFVDVMGMAESGRKGGSVYLHGWDDYEFHTLKLTARDKADVGHVAFRCWSEEALHRREKVLEGKCDGSGKARSSRNFAYMRGFKAKSFTHG